MRKASINFQQVHNISFAISHSERTGLSEPSYLLPEEFRLGNYIVAGSESEKDLKLIYNELQSNMTRQAKALKASPLWEGVINLPEMHDGSRRDSYIEEQEEKLLLWSKAFEQQTGMMVLHMSIHLDEGYLDKDKNPVYNTHAHVIVNRMDASNKIIRLSRLQMSQVQDQVARSMGMERGETLAQRDGRRGRKHLGAQEFRQQFNSARLKNEAIAAPNSIPNLQEHRKRTRREQYIEMRGFLKGTGQATQTDYSVLKILHDQASPEAWNTVVERLETGQTLELVRGMAQEMAKAQNRDDGPSP